MSSGVDLPDTPGPEFDLDEAAKWLDRALESRKPINGPPVLILSEIPWQREVDHDSRS